MMGDGGGARPHAVSNSGGAAAEISRRSMRRVVDMWLSSTTDCRINGLRFLKKGSADQEACSAALRRF